MFLFFFSKYGTKTLSMGRFRRFRIKNNICFTIFVYAYPIEKKIPTHLIAVLIAFYDNIWNCLTLHEPSHAKKALMVKISKLTF